MVRHVLPNIVAPLFILLAMDTPSAITTEAGLSFLGLGVPPPNPSWGSILAEGFSSIFQAPWAVLFASLMLGIATIGFLPSARRCETFSTRGFGGCRDGGHER